MTDIQKRILILAALAHLSLELVNNFMPIVYPLLIPVLGLTYGQVGIIAFVAVAGTSIVQPIFGLLTDRIGPVWLATLSITWTGVMMGLVGFAPSFLVLVLLVGLASIGSAAFHPPGAIVASVSGGGSRKGAAVSIFSVGGNLGAALSPLFVGLGLAAFGLSGTAILIPVSIVLGVYLLGQLRHYYVSENVKPATSSDLTSSAKAGFQGSVIGLILIVIVVMTRSWFHVGVVTYLPLWLESGGWSIGSAGTLLFLLTLSISIGSLSGGVLSDRFGRWQVAALSLVLMITTYGTFLVATGWAQITLICLIGIAIGASFPITIVMAYEAWPQRVGLAASLVMGIGWFPGGIGASVTGQLADRFTLGIAMQSLIVAPVLGLIILMLFAIYQRRTSLDIVPDHV
ncbi:MAG: MFS transporter [Chloroflexota bacterium]